MVLQAVYWVIASAATAEQMARMPHTRSSLIWKEARSGSYGPSIKENRDVPLRAEYLHWQQWRPDQHLHKLGMLLTGWFLGLLQLYINSTHKSILPPTSDALRTISTISWQPRTTVGWLSSILR